MSERTPAVSVVMPVHNGSRFVVQAIDSIRGQTFDDFELLVVDDASTDETPDLLRTVAASDRRIAIFRHPTNGGAAAARNTGLAHARADLVAVMDSDDVSLPDRFERQVEFLRAHPSIGAVGSAIQKIDAQGVPGVIKTYPTSPALASWSMLFFSSLAHSTVVMRRSLVGEGYPHGAAEDYALLAALSVRARVANLPDVLVQYRTWPGSFTASAFERQEQHATEIVQQMVEHVTRRRVDRDVAIGLRGLPRDRYPADLAVIRDVADLVERTAIIYAIHAPSVSEGRAVVRAAGTRLWLLAALAARRSARVAAALTMSAVTLSGRSGADFAIKAFRQLPRQLVALRRR